MKIAGLKPDIRSQIVKHMGSAVPGIDAKRNMTRRTPASMRMRRRFTCAPLHWRFFARPGALGLVGADIPEKHQVFKAPRPFQRPQWKADHPQP